MREVADFGLEWPMPKSVAVVNLKGGVGKTAIAVNFAAYCGMNGVKTLLIDYSVLQIVGQSIKMRALA